MHSHESSASPQSAVSHGAVTHGAVPQGVISPPIKLLRLPRVVDMTGLQRSAIYAGMRAGTFPGSVRLSARAVAWREADVLAWCASRTRTGG